jgi:hypothetical protein
MFIAIIAGKDIWFAIKERIFPKGCHVYVVNLNRHLSHYYIQEKEGVFNINGFKYVLNPYKLLGLSKEMKEKITLGIIDSKKRIEKRIDDLTKNKYVAEKQMMAIDVEREGTNKLEYLKQQVADIDAKIEVLKSKLEPREFSYTEKRKSTYLYLENDPVPKDLYEWITPHDNVQLENIILRIQTKDITARSVEQMAKNLKAMKWILFAAIGVSCIAAWFSLQNNTALKDIAANMNIALHI